MFCNCIMERSKAPCCTWVSKTTGKRVSVCVWHCKIYAHNGQYFWVYSAWLWCLLALFGRLWLKGPVEPKCHMCVWQRHFTWWMQSSHFFTLADSGWLDSHPCHFQLSNGNEKWVSDLQIIHEPVALIDSRFFSGIPLFRGFLPPWPFGACLLSSSWWAGRTVGLKCRSTIPCRDLPLADRPSLPACHATSRASLSV